MNFLFFICGIEYPDSIFQHIQIRKILLYVQNHQGGTAFESFQPMFLKLVNAQFPELFDVTTLLMEESSTSQQIVASGDTHAATSVKSVLGSSEEETLFKDHHIKAISQHLDNPDVAVKGKNLLTAPTLSILAGVNFAPHTLILPLLPPYSLQTFSTSATNASPVHVSRYHSGQSSIAFGSKVQLNSSGGVQKHVGSTQQSHATRALGHDHQRLPIQP